MARKEVWRPVFGYEGLYSVSNNGRVRSERTKTSSKAGLIIRPFHESNGYVRVGLCKNNKRSAFSVHRLVAGAFLGRNPEKQVNHINGIKTDNRLENLIYATASENVRHSVSVLGKNRGEASRNAVLSDQDVLEIRHRKDLSLRAAAKLFGVSVTTIGRIKNGISWEHLNGV